MSGMQCAAEAVRFFGHRGESDKAAFECYLLATPTRHSIMADNLTGTEYERWIAAKVSWNQALLAALVAPAAEAFHSCVAVDITKVSRPRPPRHRRSLVQPSTKVTRSMQMEANARAAERAKKICDMKDFLTEALGDDGDPVNVSLPTVAAARRGAFVALCNEYAAQRASLSPYLLTFAYLIRSGLPSALPLAF